MKNYWNGFHGLIFRKMEVYKSYFNSENDKNAYHAGSIIGRALVDFENRMDTYMNIMTEGEAKDKIKETIADDLRLLIKKVKKL